jgi:hypothetical protein
LPLVAVVARIRTLLHQPALRMHENRGRSRSAKIAGCLPLIVRRVTGKGKLGQWPESLSSLNREGNTAGLQNLPHKTGAYFRVNLTFTELAAPRSNAAQVCMFSPLRRSPWNAAKVSRPTADQSCDKDDPLLSKLSLSFPSQAVPVGLGFFSVRMLASNP